MALKKARRSERRVMTRADAHLSMRVEGSADADAPQIVTESQNISASGVYCTSDHYLAPLSKVALTIVLPRVSGGRSAKDLIKCEGIVVRCEGPRRKGDAAYELACMFSDLDDLRRQQIDAFVTWRNLQALRAATATRKRTTTSRRRTTAGATAARPARARSTRKSPTRRRTVH